MKCPVISILVPIYNVEAYLVRCIESVLNQDYRDYELILVDDGSPDNSPQIVDEYVRKYSFIRAVHKENGGLISARRAGVLAARGNFYMFLDSDDWLCPDALSSLVAQVGDGIDMVRGGAQRVTSSGECWPLEKYEFEEGCLSGPEDFLVKIYTGKVAPYLWGALYRAELFDENVFNESIQKGISLGEDTVTNMIAGMRLRKAIYIKDCVYNYFFNPSSIMSTKIVSPDYGKRLEDFLHDRVFVHYPVLLEWQKAKLAAYSFRNCFIPEVGFSSEYDHYVKYLDNPEIEEKIRQTVAPRFLLFVKFRLLYKIYSCIYRCMYRYLKQSGGRRQKLS